MGCCQSHCDDLPETSDWTLLSFDGLRRRQVSSYTKDWSVNTAPVSPTGAVASNSMQEIAACVTSRVETVQLEPVATEIAVPTSVKSNLQSAEPLITVAVSEIPGTCPDSLTTRVSAEDKRRPIT